VIITKIVLNIYSSLTSVSVIKLNKTIGLVARMGEVTNA